MKNFSAKKFMISCGITVGVLMAVMAVGVAVYAGIQAMTRPPSIPTHVEIRNPSTSGANINTQTSNNISGNTNEDIPPQILAVMERKPLFFTFLLFALDSGNNADVIIVGAYDTVAEEAFVISIPRDTFIETNRRLRKPVAAYAVGRSGGGGHEGGVAMLKADMQTLFGFTPDFYLQTDYEAFVRMVDAVDGVEINVPFHMRYDDPIDNLRINIPAGTQVLNGRQALHFARFRNANPGFRAITDYQRIENQQQIIRALFDELMTPRTIARIPEFIRIYGEHVNTNLTYREKLWFGTQFVGSEDMTVSMYTLPMAYTRREGWYEVPDREKVLELVNRTINPFTRDITAEMVRISQ
ncbi:MAG: LCP family protein [Defluviitaleaceae bacterium]|nr:LCP family protein [Defluviitaleaceae bacterium]